MTWNLNTLVFCWEDIEDTAQRSSSSEETMMTSPSSSVQEKELMLSGEHVKARAVSA